MSYSSYLMGENLFVHIARFDNEAVISDFSTQTEFQKFIDELEFRLKEEPIENDIREIGFYRNIEVTEWSDVSLAIFWKDQFDQRYNGKNSHPKISKLDLAAVPRKILTTKQVVRF